MKMEGISRLEIEGLRVEGSRIKEGSGEKVEGRMSGISLGMKCKVTMEVRVVRGVSGGSTRSRGSG